MVQGIALFFHLKVYSNTGEIVFVDFVYDIAINTLFASKEASCDKSMDNLFDSTLYSRINEELHRSFNCTVPFLPEYGIDSAGETTYICMEPSKVQKLSDCMITSDLVASRVYAVLLVRVWMSILDCLSFQGLANCGLT